MKSLLFTPFFNTSANSLSFSLSFPCIKSCRGAKKPISSRKKKTFMFLNMKMIKFWVLLLVAEAASMFLIVSPSSSSTHGMNSLISGKSVTAITSVSQPTEGSSIRRRISQDYMNLEDYRPVDPTPRSSATITYGPIEHDSPLMPYIPKVTPPNSSQQPDGSHSPPPPA